MIEDELQELLDLQRRALDSARNALTVRALDQCAVWLGIAGELLRQFAALSGWRVEEFEPGELDHVPYDW